MLKSCKYCNRIHDSKYDCGKKPVRKKMKPSKADYFRRSGAWTAKAIEIKQRDNYLCQICLRNLYDTIRQYNYENLSVHHAIPVNADYDKRLDDDNLLTVCGMHHKMCEDGQIPYEIVKGIIDEQESKKNNLGIPQGV